MGGMISFSLKEIKKIKLKVKIKLQAFREVFYKVKGFSLVCFEAS